MTTQWKKDLIKKAAQRASARREAADVTRPKRAERHVELGPLFTSGALLLGYGLLRRKAFAVAAGLAAIWLDQRSALGRTLKRRVRARAGVGEGISRSQPDPTDVASYDRELTKFTVGGPQPLTAPIEIRDYHPEWPLSYEREETRIRSILGDRVRRIEHAGSTSVPGLAAKPVIDIVLEVPDSAEESAYVPDLESEGYVLRIREPDWFEHRVFKGPDTNVNLHVFSSGCTEVDRMLLFRDWLRSDAADRELYARAKRELAARDWKYTQQYADAKTAVVGEIMIRAEAALPTRD
jgi:GrpB-like predicted nucleotidyltransferase (UPF0157 family)